MNKVKLISIDLDGTLLDDSRVIPRKNIAALNKVSEQGISIVISTGSPFELIPFEQLEGLQIDYVITANGSATYRVKDAICIYEDCVETEQIIPVVQFLMEQDIHMDIFMEGKGFCPNKCRDIIKKLDIPKARQEYLLNKRVWIEDPVSYICEKSLKVQKITINFYPDVDGTFVDKKEVEDYLSTQSGLDIIDGRYQNIEVTKIGTDKGKALKDLCEQLDISIDRTMVMGDSLNDLDSSKMAGIGIAMENALPVVKENANYITLSNEECGVADAIRYYDKEIF